MNITTKSPNNQLLLIFFKKIVDFKSTRYYIEKVDCESTHKKQSKQERPDEAIGRFTSNMVVMLTGVSDRVNAE